MTGRARCSSARLRIRPSCCACRMMRSRGRWRATPSWSMRSSVSSARSITRSPPSRTCTLCCDALPTRRGTLDMRVLALAAITADGLIGRSAHHLVNWSSREDKRMFAGTSRVAGVIVMGRSTYEVMGKPLSDRLQIVLTSRPEAYHSIAGVVEFTAQPPAEVLADLERRGFKEVVIGGGGSVYHAVFLAGRGDEVWVSVLPLLFGPGGSLFGGVSARAPMRPRSVQRGFERSVRRQYALRSERP